MKLLFDNNLSVKIADAIRGDFPGSMHVFNLGIAHYSDIEIWNYAHKKQYTIITKDKDFYHLAISKGQPPKVVWLVSGNCRNEEMIKTLEHGKTEIRKFLKNNKDILILRR